MTISRRIPNVLIMAITTLLIAPQALSAEARHLIGKVVAATDGAALDGVMIYLEGGLVFGPTAADGRFQLHDAPITSFRLDASRLGYLATGVAILPTTDSIVIRLTQGLIELNGTEVVGEQRGPRRNRTVSLQQVRPAEIKNAIGAGGDVLRSLQTLPSVAVANDFSSQLYIRGGGPEQNAVLVDGVPVYTPYRVLGALSGFNSLIIDRADLYPGGFGVRYGDRLSGVLDIAYRRGGLYDRRSEVSANALMTHVVTEGPLPDGRTSYILSARRTHYDLLLDRRTSTSNVAYPSFYDLYAKISGSLGQAGLYDVFGWFGSEGMNLSRAAEQDDDRSFAAELVEHSDNRACGVKLRLVGSPRSIHTITAAYAADGRQMNLGGDFAARFQEQRNLLLLKVESLHQLSRNLTVTLGGGIEESRTITFYRAEGLHDEANEERSPDGYAYRPAQTGFDYDHRATKASGYLQLEVQPTTWWGWSLGGRVDRNFAFTGVDLAPRIGTNFYLSPIWTLRGSAGRYYQSPAPEAFVEKNYFPDLAANPQLSSETASHYLLGMSGEFPDGWQVSLEGYFKKLNRLVIDKNDGSFTPTNDGRGRAWGVECSVRLPQRPERRLAGDLSYTLAHTNRQTPTDSYDLRYDQRHSFSANTGYIIGRGWRLATKFRWGSGYPYTDVVDRRAGLANPVETPWVPVWGPTNGARYPHYERLDTRLTKVFGWGATNWEVYLEVLNISDHQNVFRYQWDRQYQTRHAEYQLPRLPNVGLAVKF